MRFTLLFLFVTAQVAHADIPDFYQPLVITPPSSSSERLIDLTPAFERAKQLSKPMLVYLGAEDCKPCKQYIAFLEKHIEEMESAFAKFVLVDIRTWLEGPKLIFQIYDKRYSIAEFKALVGDANKELFYPTWWLLTPEGKQVRQLPQSSFYFTTVASHIRMLEGPSKRNVGANSQPTPFSTLIGKWKVQVGDEGRLREFDVFDVFSINSNMAALDAGYGWADKNPAYVDATATLKGGKLQIVITTPASSVVHAEQMDANTFRGTFAGKWGSAKPLHMSRVVRALSDVDQPFADEDKDFGVVPTRTPSTAYDAPTPLAVPGASTIKTLALKGLMESATPPIVIDAFGGTPGKRMAIPSAVWLGVGAGDGRVFDAERAKFAAVLSKLTNSDKSRAIVFYCLSVECWLSYNASLRAVEEGYKNVHWYRGGWKSWRAAGLPFERAEPFAW